MITNILKKIFNKTNTYNNINNNRHKKMLQKNKTMIMKI